MAPGQGTHNSKRTGAPYEEPGPHTAALWLDEPQYQKNHYYDDQHGYDHT